MKGNQLQQQDANANAAQQAEKNPAGPACETRRTGTASPGGAAGSAAPATSPGTTAATDPSAEATKGPSAAAAAKPKPLRDTKGQEEKAGRRATAAALTQASCRIRQSGFRLTTPALGFDEQDARLTDQAGSLNYSNSAICTALSAAPLSNWSPATQSARPFSSAQSIRSRPTWQLSLPAAASGVG